MRYKNSDDNRYRVQFMRSTEELMDQQNEGIKDPEVKEIPYDMGG